ncbi:hypothetical protein [Pseudodesulfovibrio indicus]|uniref:hypothetical protein n=1 Tax=Pseudodesulfovibrio indicus TaxID=1716143 RepID=UPI00292F4BDF|nr:hypothetical protein [Pseudodesulfovibrio indicus]
MKYIAVFAILFWSTLSCVAYAAEHDVTARASCAIKGLTAEEAQTLAVRRARSAAVEQAAGVTVTSAAMVTDGRLAGDFIKTFSQGYIVRECVTWETPDFIKQPPPEAPIVVYKVLLEATVLVPDQARPSVGLDAGLNHSTFRAGKDKLTIRVSTAGQARVAVFNITADDRVVMLYPEAGRGALRTGNGNRIILPEPRGGGSLLLSTLQGHKRDTEAIMVAALPDGEKLNWADSFVEGQAMSLAAFFRRYAAFAPHCEDVIMPYEVFKE